MGSIAYARLSIRRLYRRSWTNATIKGSRHCVHYSIFTSDSFRWPVYCNTSAGAKCSSDCDQTPAGPWPSSESDAGRRSQVAGAAHLRTGHGRAEMRPGVNCKVQCICMTYSMYYTYTYTTGYAILAVASASRSGEHVDRAA